MSKQPETILKKDHDRIIAAKDKIITELANIVDEFRVAYADFSGEATPLAERAKRAVNRKAVNDVAWPPRKGKA